jgi:hypothetical protein
MMDSPQFLHCFTAKVVPDETQPGEGVKSMAVEFQTMDRQITVGEAKTVRFRLVDASSGASVDDLSDVSVLYYRSDGRGRVVRLAKSVGDGMYEVTVEVMEPATYYVFVGVPSQGLNYNDQPFLSLMALAAPEPKANEVAN